MVIIFKQSMTAKDAQGEKKREKKASLVSFFCKA
jgi:hypothetical protein